MGGRLPPTKSLAAFFPRQSHPESPLDTCISLKDAAARHGWPADQVDLFLQLNAVEIRKTAQAVNFPLDRLTLHLE